MTSPAAQTAQSAITDAYGGVSVSATTESCGARVMASALPLAVRSCECVSSEIQTCTVLRSSCCSEVAPSVGRVALLNVHASWQQSSSRQED